MPYIKFLIAFAISLLVTFGLSDILSAIDSTVEAKDATMSHSREMRSNKDWLKLDDTDEGLFWILQISDIHISAFQDPDRGPDLMKLCEEYLPVIKPKLVLVTGDLTDAKKEDHIESKQVESEWKMYNSIIKKCMAISGVKWLDLRGNHDAFDVYDFNSENNYYKHFSVFGSDFDKEKHFGKAYHHVEKFSFGTYSFIGVDAGCLPGPNRPFNFFGHLNKAQLNHIEKLSTESASSNHTIWFGHFPTSLIVQDEPVFRHLMSRSIVYVCGHLHRIWYPMYSKHKTGQLELELGDWKQNRVFRVMAFDKDLLSFTDLKFGDWPIVIVTNPKDAQFLSKENEPVEMIKYSSHIRVLAFSSSPIKRVSVYINKEFIGDAHNISENLYVLPWDTQAYKEGLHGIRVIVTDAAGRYKETTQQFSLDGTRIEFGVVSRLLLMLNIYTVVKVMYGLLALIFVVIITLLRQCTNIRTIFFDSRNFICNFLNGWLVKFWLAAQFNASFYPIVFAVLYMSFGPWFVGDILKGRTGLVFVWGIVLKNQFIPGSLTYVYGVLQLVIVKISLFILVGHLLDLRRKSYSATSCSMVFTVFLPVLVIFSIASYFAFREFPNAYGWKAMVCSPVRIGDVFLIVYCIWKGLNRKFSS